MSKGLLAFAAGMGTGYLNQQQRDKEDARIDEDRAMRKQEFDAKMEEASAAKNLRLSLVDAAKPASTMDGTAITDGQGNRSLYKTAPDAAQMESMQAESDMRAEQAGTAPAPLGLASARGLSAGKGASRIYTDLAQADKAMADYGTSKAFTGRLADAYSANGQPMKGIELQRDQQKYDREQQQFMATAQQEGYAQTARALVTGDVNAVAKAYNSQGNQKVEGLKSTPKEIDLPGYGKVKSFDYEGVTVNADGTKMPFKINSHEANMAMMKYPELMKMQLDGNKAGDNNEYRAGLLDARGREIGLKGELGVARLAAQQAKGSNDGTSKEERLRYTSLFNESGRRMGEAQKSLSALQRDPMYSLAKPGSAQYEEMQGVRGSIKQLGEERSMYQSMLAGSQSGIQGGKANPTEAAMKENMSGGMGADPALLAREIKLTEQQAAGAKDPESKRLLTEHVASLKSQQTRLPSLADARPSSAATPAAPKTIKSAAERDALPKGTRYTAPNGQQYVKQ